MQRGTYTIPWIDDPEEPGMKVPKYLSSAPYRVLPGFYYAIVGGWFEGTHATVEVFLDGNGHNALKSKSDVTRIGDIVAPPAPIQSSPLT